MKLRQDSLLKIAVWAIRYQGFGVTLLSFLFKVIALTGLDLTRTEWYTALRDNHFDKKFNIQSAGFIVPETLDIAESQIPDINEYQASTPLAFHLIISTFQIPFEKYTFVDIGSGKGRALLMASEYPFKQILGVELSADLNECATENIRSYRSRTQKCSAINSVHLDANEFEYPNDPLIIYLYNPFKENILGNVLRRVEESLTGQPRHMIIVYFHPSHKMLFDKQDFLIPVHFEEHMRGPVRRLMPVHREHFDQAWVAV